MVSTDVQLAEPPDDARARELWLQHAAGFILFEDVRRYAIDRLDPALDGAGRAAAQQAIDDAVYGLMMVIDGVTGGLRSENRAVELAMLARLVEGDTIIEELNLAEGDGFCMGFHGWREGDFGELPVVVAPVGGEPDRRDP